MTENLLLKSCPFCGNDDIDPSGPRCWACDGSAPSALVWNSRGVDVLRMGLCEGCDAEAETQDNEGTPLCQNCLSATLSEQKAQGGL